MKKAIIIGASSGIGRELAKILYHNDYVLGLAARRYELLTQLQNELSADHDAIPCLRRIDISNQEEAMRQLTELINEMGGVDLIVISSGTGYLNKSSIGQRESDDRRKRQRRHSNDQYFTEAFYGEELGHLVVISSIAA